MADDDLPQPEVITPPAPETPEPTPMETRDVLNHEGEVVGTLSFPEGTDEAVWTEQLAGYAAPLYTPTTEDLLKERMAWGAKVIIAFRVYSMGISDEQGMQMLSNMMDVKTCLDLGMLAASAGLLASKDPDDVLDAPFSETDTRSVRQRFIDMILNEGPTP